jgi:hypothetical protein
MIDLCGGSGGENHRNLSPNREIKDLRSYYPRKDPVAGFKEEGRKSPSPVAVITNQNPEPIYLKAIEEYSGFYQKLSEHGITHLTTEVFKVLKAEGVRLITPNHFRVFDIVSADEKFIARKVAQSDKTAQRIINDAVSKGYAILDRGIFYIPKKVWKEYKARYKEVKENPALSFQIFDFSRLIKLGDSVLIDLDDVSEGDVKRFVKYLHKLGVYPNVWLSASRKGYHIQIDLIYRVVRLREVEEVDSPNGRVKQIVDRGTFYEFPYANDHRIEKIEDALKEILRRLRIPYDSVSAKRAVWLEGVYNPIKKGRSVKVYNGKVHRIDKVYENLRPLWEKTLKERALKELKRKKKLQRGTYEVVAEIENVSASNPVDYIRANLKNGTITVLLNQGLEPYEVGEVLASHYEGDEKAFWRAWRGTENHILTTYRPLKPSNRRRLKERKHRHYWEYIPKIKEALKEGITTIGGISRKAKVPKTAVWEILQKFSREQILTNTEEVIAYLKANQKGGNKLPKEKARELGKRRFKKYFEQFLKELEKKRRRKGDGRRYPLGDGKGVSSPMWKPIWIDGPEAKLDDKGRSDRALSITPNEVRNGREEVGRNGKQEGGKSRKDREKGKPLTKKSTIETKEEQKKKENGRNIDRRETKIRTKVESREEKLNWKLEKVSNSWDKTLEEAKKVLKLFGEKTPKRRKTKKERYVKLYGKYYPESVAKRIKPLIKARRIRLDSRELYEKAIEKLILRNVFVADGELYELAKEYRPLDGRKLFRLIVYLYAKKFEKVDLTEKPTVEEVLAQPSIRKLDLGGWGRYAWPVCWVLKELGLIGEETKVNMPNILPEKEWWGECEEKERLRWLFEEGIKLEKGQLGEKKGNNRREEILEGLGEEEIKSNQIVEEINKNQEVERIEENQKVEGEKLIAEGNWIDYSGLIFGDSEDGLDLSGNEEDLDELEDLL